MSRFLEQAIVTPLSEAYPGQASNCHDYSSTKGLDPFNGVEYFLSHYPMSFINAV